MDKLFDYARDLRQALPYTVLLSMSFANKRSLEKKKHQEIKVLITDVDDVDVICLCH